MFGATTLGFYSIASNVPKTYFLQSVSDNTATKMTSTARSGARGVINKQVREIKLHNVNIYDFKK